MEHKDGQIVGLKVGEEYWAEVIEYFSLWYLLGRMFCCFPSAYHILSFFGVICCCCRSKVDEDVTAEEEASNGKVKTTFKV